MASIQLPDSVENQHFLETLHTRPLILFSHFTPEITLFFIPLSHFIFFYTQFFHSFSTVFGPIFQKNTGGGKSNPANPYLTGGGAAPETIRTIEKRALLKSCKSGIIKASDKPSKNTNDSIQALGA